MYAAPKRDRDRIDGLAIFAAAAFLTGMGLVAALARVGAPDRLVEALGPLIAFFGLMIIGVVTRTARLGDFLAAQRAVPPAYGGLAFAATAAGFVVALDGGATGRSPLPWPALALGLAGAALIVGPLVRRAGASALSDILATRFPAAPTRWAFAIALWTAGVLTATAGFGAAVDIVVAHVGQSRRAAEIVVALSLAMSIVPGGLKGLLWSDAASAGGALAIAAIGAALAWSGAGAPAAPLAETAGSWLALPRVHVDSASLLLDAAWALGIGAFFAFAPAAIGAPSTQARRAGLFGLAFGLAGFALGATGFAAFWPGAAAAARSPTAGALVGAATWLPALALARAGVHGAARAAGIDLATAYARLTVLASRRLARIRLMTLVVIALSAVVSDLRLVDPPRALALALALNVALIVPSLVLAAVSSGRSSAALAAMLAGLAVLAWRGFEAGPSADLSEILVGALIAGATALLIGAVVGVFAPEAAGAQKNRARADPFVDLPFEATE
ncbi:MAG: hypothetical protein ABR878_03520 [Roseiarcus sp.]|jgi:hypothetical protein